MEGPTERILGGIIATVVGGLILFLITRPVEQVKPSESGVPVVNAQEGYQAPDAEPNGADEQVTANLSPPSESSVVPEPTQRSTAPSFAPNTATPSPSGINIVPLAARYPVQGSPTDGGIQVILESLNDSAYRFVATVRIVNRTDSEVGVALLADGAFRADVTLVDHGGGTCQMAANGESWGTLRSYLHGAILSGPANFSIIPAGQSARHTLFFNKGRCDAEISSTTDLSIRGTLAVRGGTIRTSTFSFENLPLARR